MFLTDWLAFMFVFMLFWWFCNVLVSVSQSNLCVFTTSKTFPSSSIMKTLSGMFVWVIQGDIWTTLQHKRGFWKRGKQIKQQFVLVARVHGLLAATTSKYWPTPIDLGKGFWAAHHSLFGSRQEDQCSCWKRRRPLVAQCMLLHKTRGIPVLLPGNRWCKHEPHRTDSGEGKEGTRRHC